MADNKEQEPVAYRSRWKNTKGQAITGWVLHDNKPENPEVRQETEPLYTAPVRTKDLTDDEIRAIDWECRMDAVELARAVIAADREKNK